MLRRLDGKSLNPSMSPHSLSCNNIVIIPTNNLGLGVFEVHQVIHEHRDRQERPSQCLSKESIRVRNLGTGVLTVKHIEIQ